MSLFFFFWFITPLKMWSWDRACADCYIQITELSSSVIQINHYIFMKLSKIPNEFSNIFHTFIFLYHYIKNVRREVFIENRKKIHKSCDLRTIFMNFCEKFFRFLYFSEKKKNNWELWTNMSVFHLISFKSKMRWNNYSLRSRFFLNLKVTWRHKQMWA